MPDSRIWFASLLVASALACAGRTNTPESAAPSEASSGGEAEAAQATASPSAGEAGEGGTTATELLITQGPGVLSDDDISQALRTRFLTDPEAPLRQIEVAVDDGIVTLAGEVDDLLARRRAVELARNLKGVRAVIDRMEVHKRGLSDERIARSVRELIAFNPATSLYGITVAVDDGKVTLTGDVESFAQRELAERTAASALGVTAVDNRLTLEEQPHRSDEEIAAEVRGLLAADVRVADGGIQVRVHDAKVELTGTVGSAAEKARAIRNAWVRGVEEVDADQLGVEWWARDRMRRPERASKLDDERVAANVKAALARDPRVVGPAEVEVRDGVVMLSGKVATLDASDAAASTARNTVGVWRVRNFLEVEPPNTLSDAAVEARVERALLGDVYLADDPVRVSVEDHVVRLDGRVDDAVERDRARRIVARIGGVVAVVNGLEAPVASQQSKSDWEMYQDVKDMLFWSYWVDDGAVDVQVHDGVVTLSGTVADWQAYVAALECARDAGASAIDDRLRLGDAPRFVIDSIDAMRPLVPIPVD